MNFTLTILGSNSALPANGRHPSAQVLNIHQNHYLIDCGEGTQLIMNDLRIKKNKINQIFISHLHGDHWFGLPGLITSYSLMSRTEPLEIFAPKGFQELMDLLLQTSGSHLSYELIIHEIGSDHKKKIFENKSIKVYTIPLAHRVPTFGFVFVEKPHLRNIRPEKITQYNIPYSEIGAIKNGGDYLSANGQIVPNSELTLPPKPQRSYAYCSDTTYSERIVPMITGVDLLYHEATFLSIDEKKAQIHGHSTAKQAGQIAKMAKAKRLLLGHFSSRYIDLNPFIEEAKEIFPNVELATEGKVFEI